MDIISKKQAKLEGASTYFTGRPCKHGHTVERYVSNGHCKECIDRRHKQWRKAHPEKTNAISQRWKEKNRDALTEYRKRYRAKFPEKHAKDAVEYRKRHIPEVRALSRNYKAKMRAAEGHHSGEDIEAMLSDQDGRCKACDGDLSNLGFHVDHIQPLSKGGSNWPSNLQLLCPACNLSKGDKDFTEWLDSRNAA